MQSLTKQLACALLGHVLPDAPVCSRILRDVSRGLFFSIVAAVLTVALILLGCVCFYYLLLRYQITPGMALMYTAVLLVFLIVVNALIARKYLARAVCNRMQLSMGTPAATRHTVDAVALLYASFMQGFNSKSSATQSQASQSAASHDH